MNSQIVAWRAVFPFHSIARELVLKPRCHIVIDRGCINEDTVGHVLRFTLTFYMKRTVNTAFIPRDGPHASRLAFLHHEVKTIKGGATVLFQTCRVKTDPGHERFRVVTTDVYGWILVTLQSIGYHDPCFSRKRRAGEPRTNLFESST